jgi:hypothetical protein
MEEHVSVLPLFIHLHIVIPVSIKSDIMDDLPSEASTLETPQIFLKLQNKSLLFIAEEALVLV